MNLNPLSLDYSKLPFEVGVHLGKCQQVSHLFPEKEQLGLFISVSHLLAWTETILFAKIMRELIRNTYFQYSFLIVIETLGVGCLAVKIWCDVFTFYNWLLFSKRNEIQRAVLEEFNKEGNWYVLFFFLWWHLVCMYPFVL